MTSWPAEQGAVSEFDDAGPGRVLDVVETNDPVKSRFLGKLRIVPSDGSEW